MTDAQLVALIEANESASVRAYQDDADEQAESIDYYNRKPFGTEEDGRSQVISADVYEVVEGLAPIVLKPFVSSDDIVKFIPAGPDDEEAATQETEYINYIATQRNDVFETLVSWVKTGLLQKNGIVKYWWETSKNTVIERFEELSDDIFTQLLQEGAKVISHSERTGQDGQLVHDVEMRIQEEKGVATYAVVPPEEFRVSANASSPNPQRADFVQHLTIKTISALREMGYELEDNVSDSASNMPRESVQYIARMNNGEIATSSDGNGDPSMREVLFRETYMLVDYDGDGMAELRKVCIVGTTILANEETEEIPFAGWSPCPQPFRFSGKCPADEVKEVQLIKSTLLRQTMDNIYTINNNRTYLGPGVNADDMIDNQIGGFIRIGEGYGSVRDNVMEASITPINGVTVPMIEYFDSVKENRTGFTRYNQGTDSNSLNKTATGIRIISEAGNERAGLMSRCFAEGLKTLMTGLHGLARRHGTKAETVRILGKWVEINPRNWRTRYDMSVSVGLGTADKQMQMQGAQLLLEQQMALVPSGIVKPKNFYEAAAKLAQSLGEKSPEKFFTAPPEDQPEPPPPDPMQDPEFMLKAADSKRKDGELQLKRDEFELKKQESAIAQASAVQDFKLREGEAKRAGLESFARLQHEIVTPAEEAANEEAREDAALDTLVQNQSEMTEAFGAFMQQMAASNALIAASLQASQTPTMLRVQKQSDGSFVGMKTPMEGAE